MLRVVQDRGQPDTGWSGKISKLEFKSNPGGGAEAEASTGRSRPHSMGIRGSTILTVLRSDSESEIDLEARDGSSDLDAVTRNGNLDAALIIEGRGTERVRD
jgi:hypothetical protein